MTLTEIVDPVYRKRLAKRLVEENHNLQELEKKNTQQRYDYLRTRFADIFSNPSLRLDEVPEITLRNIHYATRLYNVYKLNRLTVPIKPRRVGDVTIDRAEPTLEWATAIVNKHGYTIEREGVFISLTEWVEKKHNLPYRGIFWEFVNMAPNGDLYIICPHLDKNCREQVMPDNTTLKLNPRYHLNSKTLLKEVPEFTQKVPFIGVFRVPVDRPVPPPIQPIPGFRFNIPEEPVMELVNKPIQIQIPETPKNETSETLQRIMNPQPIINTSMEGRFPDYVIKSSRIVNSEYGPDYRKLTTYGDVSRYSSLMPWHLLSLTHVLSEYGPPVSEIRHIVDGTAHIGVDAIFLSNFFRRAVRVVAVEIDPTVCHILEKNIESVGKKFDILPVCENFLNYKLHSHPWGMDLEKTDLVYLDPPWGGPDYKKEDRVVLKLGDRLIEDVVADLLKTVKYVIVKTPLNFSPKHTLTEGQRHTIYKLPDNAKSVNDSRRKESYSLFIVKGQEKGAFPTRLSLKSTSELDAIFKSTVEWLTKMRDELPDVVEYKGRWVVGEGISKLQVNIVPETTRSLQEPDRIVPMVSSGDTMIGGLRGILPLHDPKGNKSIEDKDIVGKTRFYGKIKVNNIIMSLLENGMWSVLQPGIRACTLGSTLDIMIDNHKMRLRSICQSRNLGDEELIRLDLQGVFKPEEIIVKEYDLSVESEVRELSKDLQDRSMIISVDNTGIQSHSMVLDYIDVDKNLVIIRDPFHGWQVTISFDTFKTFRKYKSHQLNTISVRPNRTL